MKQDVKVTFYLQRTEMKEDGKCPITARLNIGKYSVSVFSTKMTVPVSTWANGRATGKTHEAIEINRRLDEIIASALTHYRELSAIREDVKAEDVKVLLLGMASGQKTLLAYFSELNKNFDERVGVNRAEGTAKSYRNALAHVTKFVNVKYKLSDIPFSALDRSFIDKYDLYLRSERRLSQNTIVLLTTRLTSVIINAIAEGIITANPFGDYVAKRPEPVQKYLTRQELDKLMTTRLTKPQH
jgi:hypothetical protein